VKKSPAPWRNRAGQDEAGSGHRYSCCRSCNYDVATSTAYCAQKRLAHAAPAMLSTVRFKTTRGKTAYGLRTCSHENHCRVDSSRAIGRNEGG
jgi:hypothetical protein